MAVLRGGLFFWVMRWGRIAPLALGGRESQRFAFPCPARTAVLFWIRPVLGLTPSERCEDATSKSTIL